VPRVETLLRLVSNQVRSETEVSRGGGGGITSDFRAVSTVPQSISAQLGMGEEAQKRDHQSEVRLGCGWSLKKAGGRTILRSKAQVADQRKPGQ